MLLTAQLWHTGGMSCSGQPARRLPNTVPQNPGGGLVREALLAGAQKAEGTHEVVT